MDSAWAGVIATVIFGLVAIAAAIFAYLTWRDARRRRIRQAVEVTSLLGQQIPTGVRLEVTLSGQVKIHQPFSAKLTLSVPSPPDVAPDAFNGAPLRVEFDAPVVWVASLTGHPKGAEAVDQWVSQFFEPGSGVLKSPRPAWPSHVDLPPALIAAGQSWELTVITEGEPHLTIPGRLTDVSWVYGPDESRWTRFKRSLSNPKQRAKFFAVVSTLVVAVLLTTPLSTRFIDTNGPAEVVVVPTSAQPGTTISVDGMSFTPYAVVKIELGGVRIGTVKADNAGYFVTKATVPPGTTPGVVMMVFTESQNSRRTASVQFRITR